MTAILPSEVLATTCAAVPSMHAEAAAFAAVEDLTGLACLLAAVRHTRATLAFLESEIETLTAGLMTSNTVVLPEGRLSFRARQPGPMPDRTITERATCVCGREVHRYVTVRVLPSPREAETTTTWWFHSDEWTYACDQTVAADG